MLGRHVSSFFAFPSRLTALLRRLAKSVHLRSLSRLRPSPQPLFPSVPSADVSAIKLATPAKYTGHTVDGTNLSIISGQIIPFRLAE